MVYYNEWEPYAAQWLRNLIAAGHLPAGEVDTRSIADVRPDDLAGFAQCHFFAGIGGWPLAAKLAGWPVDRELWTGSPPCQPFSVAGKRRGADDDRHLWPHLFRLIGSCRPAAVMGEQVAAAVGKHWLDGVLADLESIGYAGRAVVVPACAVNAPHRRDRLLLVADRDGALDHRERTGLEGRAGHGDGEAGWPQPDRPAAEAGCGMGNAKLPDASAGREQRGGEQRVPDSDRACSALAHPDQLGPGEGREQRGGEQRGAGCDSGAWDSASWLIGHDGKARRFEPGIRLLAHGVPARVGKLRALGNAIVPQVAAEVIAAYMDTVDGR